MSAPDPLAAARAYIEHGWCPVPIPPGEKGPRKKDWENLRITTEQIPAHFRSNSNIGIILGDASGGLVDVDLDCQEAVILGRLWLPATSMIHGRPGRRWSHYWYRVTDPPRREVFQIPTTAEPDREKAMLLELRGNAHQTLAPPSVHPSGERVEWETFAEPGDVELADLKKILRRIAAAALLARYWRNGQRHDATLPLAGFLLRRLPEPEATRFLVGMAHAVSADARKVEADTHDTAQKLARGQPVSGGRAVRDFFPEDVLERAFEWLGVDSFIAEGQPSLRRAGQDLADKPQLTDLGNAKRLVARHGERFRYIDGRWFHYDGTRWDADQTGEVERAAKETVEDLFAESLSEPNENRRTDLRKFAISCQSASRLRGMVELAWSEYPMPLASSALDRDPWLFNVQNGTIDLKTGVLRSHNPADLISKIAPVAYDPAATAPTWDAFLARIMPNDEMVRFLRRAVGYSLTGDISEQVFFLLYGVGANGKTTCLTALEKTFGDYAMHTPTETLMARRNDGNIPNDVARLRGARFVPAIEGSAGRRLDEAKIKQLTGGDSVTARFLHQEFFTFHPIFKLWLGTNHKPVIRGTDLAIWRRVLFIPFIVTIPERDRDPRMLERLLAEAPGILAWAVAGCLEWQTQGLTIPDAIRDATSEYRAEQDTLGGFFEDCCEQDPDAWTPFKDLYTRYRAWCEAEKEAHPLSAKAFSAALDERGLERNPESRLRSRRGFRMKLQR